MEIGKKIVELRQNKGWTQYRLYKNAGINQPTLSRIEKGINIPGTEILQKIATALGVSMAEFDCPEVSEKLINENTSDKSNANSEAINRVLDYMTTYTVGDPKREKAAQIFKSMSPDEQQQLYEETKKEVLSDDEIIKTINSLPADYRKAIEIIIRSFAKNHQ